ncbi:MAG: TonB-dependent receptor [Bacteroidia bacterium]|nr:TonB-dependent receptor [Bacteroidia bacterium]
MIPNIKLSCFLLIIALAGLNPLPAQEKNSKTITGIVNDTGGKAVPEVNVSVLDEFVQTFTDQEGKFSIVVSAGKALYFSKQGYIAVKMDILPGSNTILVTLDPADKEEIIDVAYGTRTKSELTHAVSFIRAGTLEKTPVPNLSNAIVGRTTGLTVIKTTGDEPGYDNSAIYVRGIGTFNTFLSPLILVDNVERNFAQLDPMEIESFTVLKDAAATVQYGIRGANGVINVQTKRGFTGKPEINFIAQTGFQSPSSLPEYLGSAEYVRLYNKALRNDGLPLPEDSKFDPAMYNGTGDPFKYPDVDWYGEFLKPAAPQSQYKLSLRGGTATIRYFVFMGATGQDGLYKFSDVNPQYNTNPKYSRYNLRSNVDVDVTKTLVVSVDLATRVENRHVPNSSASSIFSTLSQLPPNAMPVTNRDSSIAGTSVYRNNPLGMISKTGYRDNYQRIMLGNVGATQKLDFLLKGLSANVMMGLDGTNYYSLGRSQTYAVYQEFNAGDSTEYLKYGDNSDISINTEKFDDGFAYMLTTLGGLSYSLSSGASSLSTDLKYMQSKYFQNGNNLAYANQGIFGRATYGFRKKYFAEFGFAYNGSEDFRKGNRFGFFPSVSGAWLISNESFFQKNATISFLKLRGSFGKVGNGKLGLERFPYEQKYYSGGGYIFGSGFGSTDGSYEGRIPNPNIKWEESLNANIGIDLEMSDILNFSIDFFNNNRKNIITTSTNITPGIIGQYLPYENNGTVVNRGFEAMISHNHQKKNWSYSIQANVSYARNKILSMQEVSGLPDYQYRQGKSASAIWGLEAIGFFRNEEEIANSPFQSFQAVQPGDVKFKDQNNDNIIDYQDQIVIGDQIPQWNFGLLGAVNYKGFDLHFVLSGILGRTVLLTNNSVWVLQNNNKVTNIAYQAWEKGVNEDNATYPRLTTLNNKNNYNNSTLWARSGNYLKIINLEIGYNLPDNLMAKINVKGVRLFLNTYNLLSFDSISENNLDPEVPDAGVSGYPVMRVYNTGISVKF